MKKLFSFLLALTMVLCIFTGCAEIPYTDTDVSELESTAETTESLPASVIQKVALITDFDPIDDKGCNQACWEGIESWCSSMGIEYTHYQPIEDSNDARVQSVDQAVEEGANVIVMPGWLFGTALIDTQDKYPDVYFIAADVGAGDMTFDYVTYYEPTANAVCMTFAEEQASYLAGYAAVKEGHTQLGFYGGMAIPAVIRCGYGFVQGADAAAKEMGVDIHIKYSYYGFYCGHSEEPRKLMSWIEDGTEILFLSGNNLYLRYAKDLNAQIIACDTDASHISPNILTSAKKELRTAVEYALTGLYEGRWESDFGGQFIKLSLQDGDFVGLPTTGDSFRFQTFTMEEYESLKTQIRTGVISVSDSFEFMPTVSEHTVIEEIG